MAALYATTDESVHELITCGGLQVRIAGQIVMMLIASNEDLFKNNERAFLADLMLNPFTRTADGHYTMALDGAPDSSFTLAFYDPAGGTRITQDVFDLDSYLTGVHIQSDLTFNDLVQHPDRKYPFVFTWDGPGPLAHLLNDGAPLPDGFTLQLSLTDFTNPSSSTFGPFQSVFAVELDSIVDYVDHRGSADVVYRVSTTRDRLAHISATESLTFEVEHLTGKAGALTLSGNTDNLTFVQLGALAGRIDYDLSGKLSGKSVRMRVRDDFGDGAAYPTTEWGCK